MSEFISYHETIQKVQDFLEVAFQFILYHRNVYPQQLFESRKCYQTLVYQSRNPELSLYLGGCTKAIGEELAKGKVSKVALIIKTAEGAETPLERYLFDFTWLVSRRKVDDCHGQDFTPNVGGLLRSHVDDYMRGFILKLGTSMSYLLELPSKTTFVVILELEDDALPPQSTAEMKELIPAQWIPAPLLFSSRASEDVEMNSITKAQIRRVDSTRLGLLNLQLSVEEMKQKFQISKSQ